MLPKSSSNLLTSEVTDGTGVTLTIDFVPNEPWTIESYAEALMDELFNDLDSILDGRHKRSYPKDRQEYISGQTMSFKMPDVVLPSTVNIPLQSPPAVKNVQTAIKENSRESKTGDSRHPKRERGLQAIRIGMDYFSETLKRPNKKLIRSKLEALGMGFHGANKEQSWREFWSECGLENLPEDSELIGNSPK